jgi:uncharacterized membrane protein YsdA (DUF1294 family)
VRLKVYLSLHKGDAPKERPIIQHPSRDAEDPQREEPTMNIKPYTLFGGVATGLTVVLWGWLAIRTRRPVLSYLLSVNLITFALFAYDKWAAKLELLRVPEKVLHGSALLGGSPAALGAQQLLRHKTSKASFQLVFWVIFVAQVGLIFFRVMSRGHL